MAEKGISRPDVHFLTDELDPKRKPLRTFVSAFEVFYNLSIETHSVEINLVIARNPIEPKGPFFQQTSSTGIVARSLLRSSIEALPRRIVILGAIFCAGIWAYNNVDAMLALRSVFKDASVRLSASLSSLPNIADSGRASWQPVTPHGQSGGEAITIVRKNASQIGLRAFSGDRLSRNAFHSDQAIAVDPSARLAGRPELHRVVDASNDLDITGSIPTSSTLPSASTTPLTLLDPATLNFAAKYWFQEVTLLPASRLQPNTDVPKVIVTSEPTLVSSGVLLPRNKLRHFSQYATSPAARHEGQSER